MYILQIMKLSESVLRELEQKWKEEDPDTFFEFLEMSAPMNEPKKKIHNSRLMGEAPHWGIPEFTKEYWEKEKESRDLFEKNDLEYRPVKRFSKGFKTPHG